MAHPWAFDRFRGRVLYDFSKFARDALSKEEAIRKVKSLKTALAVATARHDVNEASRLKAEIEYYSEELADPAFSLSGDADRPVGRVAEVNQALRTRGKKERLVRGRGYYYFTEGDASSWFTSSVYMNDASVWSVDQWLHEYDRLSGSKPGKDAEFHEEDHPRGQPGNAGQFGSGGGSKSESGSEEPSKDPAIEKFRAESRAKSKGGMSAAELKAKFKPVEGTKPTEGALANFIDRLSEGKNDRDLDPRHLDLAMSILDDITDEAWNDPNKYSALKSPSGFTPNFDNIRQDPAKAAKDVLVRGTDGRWYVNNEVVPVVKTVHEALELLGTGHGVMFERPEKAVALLDKIRKITDDARKLGKKAPTYNLCQVYVASTNLFCEKNMGIPRDQMPQLGGNPTPGSEADKLPRGKFGGVDVTDAWVKELKDSGVEVEETTLDASLLRGTQNELNGAKVAGIAESYFKSGIPANETRLVVSDENYIVDGHHHWAAEVAYKQALGKPVNIRVYRVKRPILPLLNSAIEFGNRMGMPKVSVHEAGSKAA